MKLNVVIDGIIYDLNPGGGIARWYNNLLPHMCNIETDLATTLLLNKSQIPQPLIHEQINSVIVHKPFYVQLIRPRRILFPLTNWLDVKYKRKAVGSSEGKIWHSTYYTDPNDWQGKRVVGVADLIHWIYPQYYPMLFHDDLRRRMKEQAQQADAVVCISQTTANDIQKWYGVPEERIHVTPLGVDRAFHPINVTPPHKPFLLYVGGRGQYKNFQVLRQAYSQWSQRKEVDLVVVGPHWSKEEVRALESLDCHIDLRTHVDDIELARLYNTAIATVVTSEYEGFGLPYVEAMACRCALIISDIPVAREVCGDYPLYFDPHRVDSLLNALENFSPFHAAQLDKGEALAAKYTWENTARKTLDVYRQIL